MTACPVSCYWHGAAAFALETGQLDWLRAHLAKVRRLGATRWTRCTCNLWDRIERRLKEASRVH